MTGPYVGQRPWTPLIGLLAQAADLGPCGWVIVTARATGAAHALMTSPLLRRFNDLQATTLMLSGNPADGGKIRGQRFDRLPAGRGNSAGRQRHPDVRAVGQSARRRECGLSMVGESQRSGSSEKGLCVMTLRVVPEGLASASAAVEAITARLAAAHASAAPAITAVVPVRRFLDPVQSLQTAAGFSAQGTGEQPRGRGRGRGRARPCRGRCR